MLKSMEKLKVRIDQNLNRSEKSVALPLELLQIGAVPVKTKIFYLIFISYFGRRDYSDLPPRVPDPAQEDL